MIEKIWDQIREVEGLRKVDLARNAPYSIHCKIIEHRSGGGNTTVSQSQYSKEKKIGQPAWGEKTSSCTQHARVAIRRPNYSVKAGIRNTHS